jgi:hypothetical protein
VVGWLPIFINSLNRSFCIFRTVVHLTMLNFSSQKLNILLLICAYRYCEKSVMIYQLLQFTLFFFISSYTCTLYWNMGLPQ